MTHLRIVRLPFHTERSLATIQPAVIASDSAGSRHFTTTLALMIRFRWVVNAMFPKERHKCFRYDNVSFLTSKNDLEIAYIMKQN